MAMARKRFASKTPSLFSDDDTDEAPQPQDDSRAETEGDLNAVQDHRPETLGTATGTPRPTPPEPPPPSGARSLFDGLEEEPRDVEGDARAEEAGERSGADSERSAGTRSEGTGGPPVSISEGGWRATVARRGNGIPQRPYTSRVAPRN